MSKSYRRRQAAWILRTEMGAAAAVSSVVPRVIGDSHAVRYLSKGRGSKRCD